MKNSTIREVEKLEAAMDADPPRIVWQLDRARRIQVAVEVYDPHAEMTTKAQAGRLRASADRAEYVLEQMEDEAREVTERFRKHRADNTPLLAAARTEI